MAGVSENIAVPAEERWSFSVTRPQESGPAEQDAEKKAAYCSAEPDAALLAKLESDFDFVYPYLGIGGMCAKVAASELAAGKFSARYAASSRPAFLGEGGLTPAERGTALHAYLQFADYRKASSDPEQELSRLVEENFLTSWQAQAVDLGAVGAFFNSPVARRMLSSVRLEREFRFSVEIPARKIQPELTGRAAEEPVILQGAADCVFEEADGLVIVDYKTDRTRDPAELWTRYQEQLDWYRCALELCTGKKVKQCLLYSFALGTEITGNNS
jgi:ATP-dependent helicase/nuclease subunit A